MAKLGKTVKIFVQVYGIIAMVATVAWTVTRDATARDAVCPTLSRYFGHQIFCGRGYEAVPAKQAEDVLFQYFQTANASGFYHAWDLLDSQMKDAPPYKGDMKAYSASLHDTLWGETTKAPDRGEVLNEFIAHVRFYQLDGDVVPYAIPVTLRRSSEGRVLIVRIENARRDGEGQRQPYAWAYLKRPQSLHARPRLDSDLTLLAQDELQTGEEPRLRALCEVDLGAQPSTSKSPEADWWTLTNQGWIENSDLTTGGDPLGILNCSQYIRGR